MSLFDTIKYPVNYPLERSQLEAIPAEIIKEWLNAIGHRGLASLKKENVLTWFFDYPLFSLTPEYVIQLRKIIEEL